jgi:predicted ArsR family transcriptional regulator
MLQRLLALVSTGETVTPRGLAEALGVTEGLVEQMVEQLTARGYLATSRNCDGGCGGCGLADSCGTQQGLRLWTLTAKGRRALQNR